MTNRRKNNRYKIKRNYLLDKVVEVCKNRHINQVKFLGYEEYTQLNRGNK